MVQFASSSREDLNQRKLTKESFDAVVHEYNSKNEDDLKKDHQFAYILKLREFREAYDVHDVRNTLLHLRQQSTAITKLISNTVAKDAPSELLPTASNMQGTVSNMFRQLKELKQQEIFLKWAAKKAEERKRPTNRGEQKT